MKALARDDPQRLQWQVGHVTHLLERDGAISGIEVSPFHTAAVKASPKIVDCDQLLVFFGLSPNLGPIADWGLEIEKRQLEVNPESQQTSTPGIFAIGDISIYPGKKKLILTGFHEAAIAAYGVQKFLNPLAKQTVQYTTTSSTLQKRLGVDS